MPARSPTRSSSSLPTARKASKRRARSQGSAKEVQSIAFEADETRYWHARCAQFLGAAEVRQVDHEARADHVGAGLAEQAHSGERRPSRGDEVVDQQDLLARNAGIFMHDDAVGPVFQCIID